MLFGIYFASVVTFTIVFGLFEHASEKYLERKGYKRIDEDDELSFSEEIMGGFIMFIYWIYANS